MASWSMPTSSAASRQAALLAERHAQTEHASKRAPWAPGGLHPRQRPRAPRRALIGCQTASTWTAGGRIATSARPRRSGGLAPPSCAAAAQAAPQRLLGRDRPVHWTTSAPSARTARTTRSCSRDPRAARAAWRPSCGRRLAARGSRCPMMSSSVSVGRPIMKYSLQRRTRRERGVQRAEQVVFGDVLVDDDVAQALACPPRART